MVKRKANSNILMISLIIVGCIIYFFQLIYSPDTLVGEQGLRQAKLCLVISLIWHLIVGVIIGYYIPFALMLYFNTNDKLMKHSKKIIAISVIAFIIAFTFIGKSNYFRWYSEPFSSGKSSVAQDFRMLRNVILDQINEETIEVPVNTYKIVKGIITFRKRRRHTHKSTYYIEVNDGQFMIPVSEEDINLLKAYMLKGTNLLTLYKNSGFLVAINGKNEPVSYLEAEIEDILKNYYSSFINLTIDSNGIATRTEGSYELAQITQNDSLCWLVKRNGNIILERNAVDDLQTDLPVGMDGEYVVYMQYTINSSYTCVSNVVNFTVKDGKLIFR